MKHFAWVFSGFQTQWLLYFWDGTVLGVRVERVCGAGKVRVRSMLVRGEPEKAGKNSEIPAGAGR